jgi:uncharacterized protein (UPF0332 family)
LELAKGRLGTSEMLLREGEFIDSMNRSYYAVFYAAKALLATEALDSEKHSGVISLFNRHFVKAGMLSKEMSKIIERTRFSRERGDYEDYAKITKTDAEYQLKKAREFVAEVERVLSEKLSNDE